MNTYGMIFDEFLKYYRRQCDRFITEYADSHEAEYFKEWRMKEGDPAIDRIRQNLDFRALDDRLEGFAKLYTHYIDMAWERRDQELILENLFAVPEYMQREFTEFGFMSQEAVSRVDDWESSENFESSEIPQTLVWSPEQSPWMKDGYWYVGELDSFESSFF